MAHGESQRKVRTDETEGDCDMEQQPGSRGRFDSRSNENKERRTKPPHPAAGSGGIGPDVLLNITKRT